MVAPSADDPTCYPCARRDEPLLSGIFSGPLVPNAYFNDQPVQQGIYACWCCEFRNQASPIEKQFQR